MPFVALSGGELIAPPQADTEGEYECPACGDALNVRRGHHRNGNFVVRHFWHPNGGNCEGESDQHRKMKSIAFWKAGEKWPDATVQFESPVEIKGWESSDGVHPDAIVARSMTRWDSSEWVVKRERRADVLVKFEDENEYGQGVAIECQYKNDGKDVYGVEHDYISAGFSVLWLYPEHFTGMDVDLNNGEWVINPPDSYSQYTCTNCHVTKRLLPEHPVRGAGTVRVGCPTCEEVTEWVT